MIMSAPYTIHLTKLRSSCHGYAQSELEGAKSQILELEESKFEADKEKKSLKSQLKELKRKEKEVFATLYCKSVLSKHYHYVHTLNLS